MGMAVNGAMGDKATPLIKSYNNYIQKAAAIHRVFARTLAEKLVLANNAIRLAQR